MTEPNIPEGMDQKNPKHPKHPKHTDDPTDGTVPDVTPAAGESPRAEAEPDLSPDELALRRMLREAVRDIQPGPETLTHLRRAVPARRTHRRQLLVGTAAAGLLAVAAVPAVLHAANQSGWDAPDPVVAAGASSTTGTEGEHSSDGKKGDKPSGPATGVVTEPTEGSGGKPPTQGASGQDPAPHTSESSARLDASSPPCTATDLGDAAGWAGAADAAGRVSGYFRVANVSAGPCSIDGGGAVTATAQGSADPLRISVLDHVAGDGSGLPDGGPEKLVLKAGASYEVQFAWVPATGGDISGCAAPPSSPTPTATGSADPPAGEGTSAESGTTLDAVPADGAPAASVELSHTPAAGSPVVSTTIAGACAGTVYHTGPLALS